jgi:hypothetical protein
MNKIEHIILQDTLDDSIRKQPVLYKGEVFEYFDTGLTRYVFVNKDKTKVIKILIKADCIDYNQEELEIYENADEETRKQLAETEMSDSRIIEQEFCNPIKFDDRKLTIPQIRFAGACRNEVGWDLDGNLKCFDLDEYMKY